MSEGFGWEGLSEEDVDAMVFEVAHSFAGIGATVKDISIPWHRDGPAVWQPIANEGATRLMVEGNSMGTNWKGHYLTGLLDVYARGRISRADDLSDTTKLTVLFGHYMQQRYHGRYYAKAQNLARSLKRAYDEALQEHDLLVMPTLPMKATLLPDSDVSREEYTDRGL